MYQQAVVQRVLPGLGVVFRLPSSDGPAAAPLTAGFAHISALSDTRVDKVEKVRTVKRRTISTLQKACNAGCMLWHNMRKSDP